MNREDEEEESERETAGWTERASQNYAPSHRYETPATPMLRDMSARGGAAGPGEVRARDAAQRRARGRVRVRDGFGAHQRRALACMTRVRPACTHTAEQTRCPRVTVGHSLQLGISGHLDSEDFCAAELMKGKTKQSAALLIQAAAAQPEEEIVGLRNPRLPVEGSVSPLKADRDERVQRINTTAAPGNAAREESPATSLEGYDPGNPSSPRDGVEPHEVKGPRNLWQRMQRTTQRRRQGLWQACTMTVQEENLFDGYETHAEAGRA